MNQSTRFLRF